MSGVTHATRPLTRFLLSPRLTQLKTSPSPAIFLSTHFFLRAPSPRTHKSERSYATVDDYNPCALDKKTGGDEPTRSSGPPPAPPPKPEPSRLTFYSASSLPSALARTLLEGIAEPSKDNPFPLDFKGKEVKPPGAPSEEEWTDIREIMMQNLEDRSLSHRKPAVLVKEDAQATYYNTVPDKFRPPLLVNWTRRRVCHGSMFYSEVEHMVREMRTEQKERFQAELVYDQYLLSIGQTPPKREKARRAKINKEELIILTFIGVVAAAMYVDYYDLLNVDATSSIGSEGGDTCR